VAQLACLAVKSAGGCEVGSVSNSAVFATTAWIALTAIWASAMSADAIIDWPQERGHSLVGFLRKGQFSKPALIRDDQTRAAAID
jgi:hypothetical protein